MVLFESSVLFEATVLDALTSNEFGLVHLELLWVQKNGWTYLNRFILHFQEYGILVRGGITIDHKGK